MLIKTLLMVLAIYWGIKLLKSIFSPISTKQEHVHGKPNCETPLDLSQYDVEDADFEEMDEKQVDE